MRMLTHAVHRHAYRMFLSVLMGVVVFVAAPGQVREAQAQSVLATRTFTVKNSCGYTIYPGIYPASTYSNGGWTLAPGAQVTFSVPDGNIGRLWGRTGCNGASPAACATGSCGGTGLQCAGTTGFPNTSLFEWNINANGTDWYDISYVDAVDNPMGVQVSNSSCHSPNSCSNAVLTNCPSDLRSGNVCLSPCTRYNTDQYCCRGAFGNPNTCVVANWAASARDYVNNIHNSCPRSYAYAYDEISGGALHTCPTGASYTITFCPSGGGGGNGVTFFRDINFGGGNSGAKAKGNYPVLPGDIPNDWMSSLQIPAGWTVQAFEHGGFGGSVCTFTSSTSWIGHGCNDKMSSFKIF